MRLLIDNLDGAGAVDYSAVVAAEGPVKLHRRLNAPSLCTVTLNLAGQPARKIPLRRGRVVLTSDAGVVLFTGYLPGEPEVQCVGAGATGNDSLLVLAAQSDDWLLDQQGTARGGAGFGLAGDALLRTLTSRTDPQRFTTSSAGLIRTMGLFAPDASRSWSVNAGALADGSYSAYRVVAGVVELAPGGAVTHVLSDADGTLDPMGLRLQSPKALANDVTVSGEREPAAYVTEIFAGDGTTAIFGLNGAPFRLTGRGAMLPLDETFQGDGFDPEVWQVADPGSHFSFSGAGLALGGGNGLDGQTTLVAIDPVELGGTTVLEAGGVVLGAGSDGVLCGVYSGVVNRANCLAGFHVGQSAGATTVQPLVNGVAAGTTATLASGHQYVLRLRLHAVEMHRVQQTYYAMVDGQVESFGGGAVPAQMNAVLELVDQGASSNTPATVLFDGLVASAPASCAFAAVNSVQLIGSINYVRITRGGPVWVTSTSGAGATWTRLIGAAGEGVDCEVTAAGKLEFFAGRVPAAGETVRVFYRGSQRAIARLQNKASVAAESLTNLPGAAVWSGHMLAPVTRNSIDCANAAAALLAVGTSRTAALEGTYVATNPGDVWPGDLLQVETGRETLALMVRKVTVEDQLSLPEAVMYRIEFANDWAQELSLRTSGRLASDVVLPVPIEPAGGVLPGNLGGLTVIGVTATAIQIDAGVAPAAGGGFEVRRRDGGFAAGVDQDLVLRSPVRGFSIPRAAQTERYFVRMYDGSAVPLYSAMSSAIYTHVPVS